MNLSLADLFNICGSAFTLPKLLVASGVITAAFLTMLTGNWLIRYSVDLEDIAGNEVLRSVLTIIPFAVMMFMYIISSAVISRMTVESQAVRPGSSRLSIWGFVARSIIPVLLSNIILFAIIDLVFILFGRIPVIGPLLFAILFLPIYLTSLCAVILLAIGFWFYPPIIAVSIPTGDSPVRGFFRFIRTQNFSLAYTIPLMSLISAVAFAAIYLLHYGSFSLSLFLSRTVLGDEGMKIFSSIPSPFLQFSDLAIIGSEPGLFRSLSNDLPAAHAAAGYIIGIIFSFISIALFAAFISLTATLSTRLYLMLEEGADIDDSSKIRLLVILVLALAGVFLAKKIFM